MISLLDVRNQKQALRELGVSIKLFALMDVEIVTTTIAAVAVTTMIVRSLAKGQVITCVFKHFCWHI